MVAALNSDCLVGQANGNGGYYTARSFGSGVLASGTTSTSSIFGSGSYGYGYTTGIKYEQDGTINYDVATQNLQNGQDYNEQVRVVESQDGRTDTVVDESIDKINLALESGRHDKILDSYDEFCKTLRSESVFASYTDAEIRQKATELFEAKTGCTIGDAVKASLPQGWWSDLWGYSANSINDKIYDKDREIK